MILQTQRLIGPLAALLLAGCHYEASFKPVTFQQVQYDRVFDRCHEVVRRYYTGIMIRSDRDAGSIETDPVEFTTSRGTRREQVYVKLDRVADDTVMVELFAPMSELVLDPDAVEPMQWRVLGSDVKQERLMLDEIIGEVLRDHPQGQVRETEEDD